MRVGKPFFTGKGKNRQLHVYVYSTRPTKRHGSGRWKIKLTNKRADWDTSWIGKAK